jgi:hypothetical protein
MDEKKMRHALIRILITLAILLGGLLVLSILMASSPAYGTPVARPLNYSE